MHPVPREAGVLLLGTGAGVAVASPLLGVVVLLIGALTLGAFGYRPVRNWLGLPGKPPSSRDEIGVALQSSVNALETFLRDRAYESDLPKTRRLGDGWWRHYHGDADYQTETARQFDRKFKRDFEKLLRRAAERGFEPAGPDLAFLATTETTEDLWVFLLRAWLSARELTANSAGVVERIAYTRELAQQLRDALPTEGPVPEWATLQARSVRQRLYLALLWSPDRTRLYAAKFNDTFPDRADLEPDMVPDYVRSLGDEMLRLEHELSNDRVPA